VHDVFFFIADIHPKQVTFVGLWPLSYFIASFPPSLRHLLHVGLHVAALDAGNRAAADCFSRELLDLWENGLEVAGTHWQVAVIVVNMDTKGYEYYRGQQGGASYHGCYDCLENTGSYVCGRMVHNCHRRYLPLGSSLRKKSVGPSNPSTPFFSNTEVRPANPLLLYADYIHFSDQFVAEGRRSAISGCKEPWNFRDLPYASFIATVTDPMHIFGNVIGDSLLLLRPGDSNKPNRSAGETIIKYEQETNRRFLKGDPVISSPLLSCESLNRHI
jgi:hypothetical protein